MFESYLEEKFLEQYTGTKDEASDAFGEWLAQLDNQELIDYGNNAMVELKEFYEFAKKPHETNTQ